MDASTTTLQGDAGQLEVRTWAADDPTFTVLLAHGLGEHAGRYDHVAARLTELGGAVYAPDHRGHGRSAGTPGVVDDVEGIVADLGKVADLAAEQHPGLPVVLIGHSLGGIIATRYLQTRGTDGITAAVLSAPVIGGNAQILGLLELDPIPDVPIDPSILSRDPAVGEAYAADPLVYHGPLRRETLVSIRDTVQAVADGGDLGDLPTLWLHGEEDGLAPLAETRAAFDIVGGSALEERIYPGARHEVFNETNQDEVLDAVTEFLQRTVPARG